MNRDVTFPEPTPWNGDDDRPMPSATCPSGPVRRHLKESLYAAIRIYGLPKVREALDQLEQEMK